MPGVSDSTPVSDDEVASAFPTVLGQQALMLAVSGGSDSMALMYLAAARRKAGVSVVTVDHGLRPEAADEAGFVVREAEKLGLEAIRLKWDGPHPETGVPAAAREARYALMAEVCRERSAALVTAHTQDDQAETLLMALARGAGINGLSAMQAVSEMNDVALLRPLLGFSRGRLRATLRRAGIGWVDDPSNRDEKYERVRVRKALDVLGELGAGRSDIARSAHRLARARTALDEVAQQAERDCVVHDPAGFARIQLVPFNACPDEIRLRMLVLVAARYGGGTRQSLSGGEAVLEWINHGKGRARTFAGCRFARRASEVIVGREEARISEPARRLEPGDNMSDWDGRYAVSVRRAGRPVTLFAVRDAPAQYLPSRPSRVPAFVWNGLPVAIDELGEAVLPGIPGSDTETLEQNAVFSPLHRPDVPQS